MAFEISTYWYLQLLVTDYGYCSALWLWPSLLGSLSSDTLSASFGASWAGHLRTRPVVSTSSGVWTTATTFTQVSGVVNNTVLFYSLSHNSECPQKVLREPAKRKSLERSKEEHQHNSPSIMNAKLSMQRFWHCHENRLIKRIQTIPHNLKVRVKSAYLYWGLG